MIDRVTIVGLVVAGYGAVLATVNSVIQVLNHKRDRVDVALNIRRNMVANIPRYAGMTLTLVTATSKGKRPVTIEGFALRVLDSRRQYFLPDVRPQLPCTLAESQSVTAHVSEAGHDQSHEECYYVWDSVGRKFYANVAPWHRRLVSKFRRRFAKMEERDGEDVAG